MIPLVFGLIFGMSMAAGFAGVTAGFVFGAIALVSAGMSLALL
jgi:hypothetical protein